MLSLFEDRGGAATRPRAARLASVTGLLACCAPLFVLVMHSWSNAVLFLAALLSLVLLARGDLPPAALDPRDRRWMWATIAIFVAPLAAAFASAALRGDFLLRQFDAPSRFLLAIPVFLFALRSRLAPAQALQWILPLALGLALAELEIHGHDPRWRADRATTHVVDPLVFGYLTLAFGLMCLVSIAPGDWRGRGRWSVLVRLAGLALGLYLSVRSGSRSGWLAVPIVVGVWLHHHWGRGHRFATAAVLLAAAIIPLAAYLLVPAVADRVDLVAREIADYSWHTVSEDTSIGLRITYLRIAADLFALYPWGGIGDTARAGPELVGLFAYASPKALQGAFGSAFHNQIVSNAVRNGIPGLVATAALLLVPLLVCARALARGAAGQRQDAAMGMAFCTCLFVSSLSTEVVDLKFAASLYAVMAAVLCGAALAQRDAALGAGAD